MTKEEGYVGIALKDYDRIFFVKEGYNYKLNTLLESDKLQKEYKQNLSLYIKDKKSITRLYDDCLKISEQLLAECPHNKMLQNFLEYLNKIDVIIAKLPDNEIVDIKEL